MEQWGYQMACASGFNAGELFMRIFVPYCRRQLRNSQWRDFVRGWDRRRHELERLEYGRSLSF